MKKKILLWASSIGASVLLFGQGLTAFADAEHLGNADTYTYIVPSDATINSYGVLSFEYGDDNSILIDSADIQYLQNELTSLFGEIDAYTGNNTAGL